MVAHVDLLPGNAPPWARLFGETIDPRRSLGTGYENVYFAGEVVPPQFVPWLIWQLGLAELTPYVPSIGQLISEGVAWQRVRGTPSAIGLSLSWLGYSATLHEAASRRKKWHRFQIELDRVRDADLPDLVRIYGVVSLSPPARSRFTRGFKGYDIRAAETSYQRTSGSLTSDHWRLHSGRRCEVELRAALRARHHFDAGRPRAAGGMDCTGARGRSLGQRDLPLVLVCVPVVAACRSVSAGRHCCADAQSGPVLHSVQGRCRRGNRQRSCGRPRGQARRRRGLSGRRITLRGRPASARCPARRGPNWLR